MPESAKIGLREIGQLLAKGKIKKSEFKRIKDKENDIAHENC